MVCPRCIETVNSVFQELKIPIKDVQLGEVETENPVDAAQKKDLDVRLRSRGFELLQDHKAKLIGQIKSIVIEQVHHSEVVLKTNFSTLLMDKLHMEYSALSRLFSSVEGVTIERFVLKQKAEKVKELLFYNESTLSEIAFQMGYSSVAHLSAQFKKETGMTPSSFKKLKKPGHRSLDTL